MKDAVTADLAKYEARQDGLNEIFESHEKQAIDSIIFEMTDYRDPNSKLGKLGAELISDAISDMISAHEMLILVWSNFEEVINVSLAVDSRIENLMREYLTQNERGQQLVAERVQQMEREK